MRAGDYEIGEEMARGGSGAVYRATHLPTGRAVAIKVLLATGVDVTPNRLTRFAREAEALARMRHPNVVQVHELVQLEGRPCIVLDLVEGGSLGELIEREGALDSKEAASLTLSLARALQHGHERSILHRDVKPANVLLTHDRRPLLTDFGLAKELSEERERLTRTGQLMGTPNYMAPEQAGGAGARVSVRTDVYSLGGTLYTLLTAKPPFVGESLIHVLAAVCRDDPVPPRKLRPDVPRDLEAICLKCLEKDPADRYATAADLAEDLERFVRGDSVEAKASGKTRQAVRWAGRNRTLVWAIALALSALALPLGLIAAGGDAPLQPPAPTPAKDDPALAVAGPTGPPTWFLELDRSVRPALPLPRGLRFGEREVYVNDLDGSPLVWIPSGTFQMGSVEVHLRDPLQPSADSPRDLSPHLVTLSGFFMGKLEITQRQYERYCEATGLALPTRERNHRGIAYTVNPDDPISLLTWSEAVTYSAWAGGRLPTEAEWEYAARGPNGRRFPWGDVIALQETRGRRVNLSAGSFCDSYPFSCAVGTFPEGASPFGCLNMGGNAAEWVADWYGLYPRTAVRDPKGPLTGTERVLRGGMWGAGIDYARTFHRRADPPATRRSTIGFRMCRDAD